MNYDDGGGRTNILYIIHGTYELNQHTDRTKRLQQRP